MSVRNLAVETLRCPTCGAAEGVECNTVVNGEQTHWTHDARWTAKFMADVRASVTTPADPYCEHGWHRENPDPCAGCPTTPGACEHDPRYSRSECAACGQQVAWCDKCSVSLCGCPTTPEAQAPLHFGYLSECPDGMGCERPGCLLAHVTRPTTPGVQS